VRGTRSATPGYHDDVIGSASRRTQNPLRLSLARRFGVRVAREAKLTGLAIWRGVVGVYNSEDMTFAASIAYYALLSLFPFFLLIFSLLGTLIDSDVDRAPILGFVLRYFPQQFEFVNEQLHAFEQSAIRLGLAGSILMVWAAMGVFGAVTSAINHAWGVDKQPNYFKHKLISFVMLACAGILLIAGLLLVSAINVAEAGWFAVVMRRTPGLLVLQGLALKWASTFLFIVIVGLVFYFVPNAKVRFKDVWVGAILTGLLWRGALAGFSWYVRDASRFSVVHGRIAAVVVFLLWVYVSAVILLYGAEMTAAYARLRRHRPAEIPAAPAPRV
jgi:membrane protein